CPGRLLAGVAPLGVGLPLTRRLLDALGLISSKRMRLQQRCRKIMRNTTPAVPAGFHRPQIAQSSASCSALKTQRTFRASTSRQAQSITANTSTEPRGKHQPKSRNLTGIDYEP